MWMRHGLDGLDEGMMGGRNGWGGILSGYKVRVEGPISDGWVQGRGWQGNGVAMDGWEWDQGVDVL